MHGQRVEIWLNGVKINDYTSTRTIANGYIGVQNDGAGADINYRNIRIKTDGGPPAGHRHRPGQAGHGVQRGAGATSPRERGRTATPPPAGAAPTPTRSGSPSTSGGTYNLNRVRLNWEAAYGRAYQIQTSPNNATWTTVYSTTTGDGGVDDLTVTGTGRYVRVNGTQRGHPVGLLAVGPQRLRHPGVGTPPTLLSPGPAHRRVQRGDRQRARRRERGRRQHRHPLGQRLRRSTVDLRRPRRRRGRSAGSGCNWEAAFARAYQIQISPDNATWTNVYSTTTGDGGVDDVTVTGTGRYVRVYGTQRALTQYGYSLWEFEVYGPV